MAVSKKDKRKIVVDNRIFYWYVVAFDEDAIYLGAESTLTIVSDDKNFLVKYSLQQQMKNNVLIVLGKDFCGEGDWGNCWLRVESPKFETSQTVSPSIVKEIILWSLSEKDIKLLNYLGETI